MPGSPKLTVVGIATSVTGTAQAWVAPSEIAALQAAGAPKATQMLYRFSGAGTAAGVSAAIGEVTAALPPGSVLGTQSWLAAKAEAIRSFAPWVPFIVAFGLIGHARADERGAGHRGRTGAETEARVPGPPAARPGSVGPPAAPAGDHRPGWPVRPAGPDPGHAGRDRIRCHRRDLRVRPELQAQPGTLHHVTEASGQISLLGQSDQLSLAGFGGDASWTGYAMIAGHWYDGPDQVDVNTAFLAATGATVGQQYTLASGGKHVTVQIAGEVFDPAGGQPEMIGAISTLSAVDPGLAPDEYLVQVKPGTDIGSYVNALSSAPGKGYLVSANDRGGAVLPAIEGLVGTLTLVIALVAGLGVLNTVVLQTRERVHDLGVFKAVGMTPRQTITMVVSTVAGTGLVAGLAAIPAGVALHRYVLPVMGHAVQTALPAAVLDVYHAPELVLLALSGLAIAVTGALAPGGWAARARTAAALRAE